MYKKRKVGGEKNIWEGLRKASLETIKIVKLVVSVSGKRITVFKRGLTETTTSDLDILFLLKT